MRHIPCFPFLIGPLTNINENENDSVVLTIRQNYYFQLVFQVNLSFSLIWLGKTIKHLLRFEEAEKLTGSSHPNERDIAMRIEEMLSTFPIHDEFIYLVWTTSLLFPFWCKM